MRRSRPVICQHAPWWIFRVRGSVTSLAGIDELGSPGVAPEHRAEYAHVINLRRALSGPPLVERGPGKCAVRLQNAGRPVAKSRRVVTFGQRSSQFMPASKVFGLSVFAWDRLRCKLSQTGVNAFC
jgi:hypothetical protein